MQIPIGKVETPDEFLTAAFYRARKAAGRTRGTLKGKGLTRLIKSRALEMTKISVAAEFLFSKMEALVTGFPSLNQLAPFYKELINCTLDPDYYKKSLGAVDWANKQIRKLAQSARDNLRKAKSMEEISKYRNAFYGRAASVLKQIKKELAYLEECRRTIREFPSIKTDLPTVAIAGYPNVGKSTLLKALTGSAPKIAPYPFTTTNLMFGYAKKIQFIDTPGLLDKPFAKRNPVEKQAILALKHLTNLIVFVIDPTESCGYSLNAQTELLAQVRSLFNLPILIVLTKMDMAKKEQIIAAKSAIKGNIEQVDTTKRASIESLLSVIEKSVRATQKPS